MQDALVRPMKKSLSAFLLTSTFAATGCASWFMNGGKLVKDDYKPSVKTSYTVTSCKTIADGKPLNGPAGIVFKLVEDEAGRGLFEQSADGSGAVITNAWSDEKGDHYFGWVQSSGWEYVIPTDSAQTPVRVIYTGVKLRKEGEVTKPISEPVAICEMSST
jgi:hypothetical protein